MTLGQRHPRWRDSGPPRPPPRPLGITPPTFMFLEAQPQGPMVFIASTPDGGNVQIAGRADVWATGRAGGGQASSLPGVYASPTEAAEALARQAELVAYTNAGSYCLWRERLARRRLSRARAAGGNRIAAPVYSTHVPPAPHGFTLSEDCSAGAYRFYAGTRDGGTAVLAGRGTRWQSVVVGADGGRHYYGAEWTNPEEAAGGLVSAGYELGAWAGAADQQREYPDTVPLIDEHGDTLWVVSRGAYYRLGDLDQHERRPPDRAAARVPRTPMRVI